MKITVIEEWKGRADGIERYLKGHDVAIIRSYEGESIPRTQEVEALLLTGGPQSLCEIEKYPYLINQIPFIKSVVDDQKPVLGICLGHQLLAYTMGASIRKSALPEIGWYAIAVNDRGKDNKLFARVPQAPPMFEYHLDEVCDDMGNLAVLASTPAVGIQAYQVKGKNAWGVQFHPEIDAARAKEILDDRSYHLRGIAISDQGKLNYSRKDENAPLTLFANVFREK